MQTCRYKRVPVMFLDLFCEILHTTSAPRNEYSDNRPDGHILSLHVYNKKQSVCFWVV